MALKNQINTYADLTAYNDDQSKEYPNVSYIVATDEVKWQKNDPVHIVAVYNVTSTSEATKLLYSNTNITYQIIDGVQQQSVQRTYTFDTLGEHIVKYKLNGTYIRETFNGCTNLTSIVMPNGITSIQYRTFYNCTGLTSVTIPDGVTLIDNSAFYGCTSLTSVTIPDSVTRLEYAAFGYCSGLTSVTMGSGVTTIGDSAFNSCTNLTNINIPNSVVSIGLQAFYNCNSLPVENGVRYADTCATGVVNKNQTTYTLKEGTRFLSYTFNGCSNLTNINIPDGIVQIGHNTFDRCTNLTSVTIPDSVTSIDNYAFDSCSSLTSITIPDGVTSIGKGAFYGCSSLTSVTVEATTPPTLGTDAFYYTNNCPIYVPASSVEAYKTATNWSTYASIIQPIPTT